MDINIGAKDGRMNGVYDFLDQPVVKLSPGSRLLLWSLRAWADALARKTCPPAALAPAYAMHDMLPAVNDLNMAAALLNSNGRTKFMLAPLRACRVAEDEALLINLWRDVAAGEDARAKATLEACVDKSSVGPLLTAVGEHAAKMTVAGFAPLGLSATQTTDERA
ncbi:hypothetical protein [Sphingoaurantiacus capsulatus]